MCANVNQIGLLVIQDKAAVPGDGTKEAAASEDDGTKMAQMVCSLNNREDCLACGS